MPIPEFCKGGDFNKFTVIKNNDIKKLPKLFKRDLNTILSAIRLNRITEGKTTHNTYLVINTDEPYAPEIVDILKRNGHWG